MTTYFNTPFNLSGKTALITGGGGLLGPKHAEAIVEAGGKVILADINFQAATLACLNLNNKYSVYEQVAFPLELDVCDHKNITRKIDFFNLKIDILINNAALDPKIKADNTSLAAKETRFETMSFDYWQTGIDAIVNGTFVCSQALTNYWLKKNMPGIILNIASDLSVIAPDQRIYRKENLQEHEQPVKPITYSAAKFAVVGMTKYLAVYLAKNNIRVNCLSPTGVYNNHPEEFVEKLSNIIPMGRMANINEYKGAIMFLCSDASSYMTGHNLVIDGGKTVW